MIAIGCLAPLILGVVGGLLGNAVLGPEAVLWGAGAGFGIGGACLGGMMWVVAKMKA